MLEKKELTVADLPKINPLQLPKMMNEMVEAINKIPSMPSYYPEREENHI